MVYGDGATFPSLARPQITSDKINLLYRRGRALRHLMEKTLSSRVAATNFLNIKAFIFHVVFISQECSGNLSDILSNPGPLFKINYLGALNLKYPDPRSIRWNNRSLWFPSPTCGVYAYLETAFVGVIEVFRPLTLFLR